MFYIFVKTFLENKIFLEIEMEIDIQKAKDIFAELRANIIVANNNGKIDYEWIIKANEKQKEIDPILDIIGERIQKRLCFHEAY